MNNTTLQELLFSALSFSEGKGSGQWERHLTDAFNAFLGGRDIFETTANYEKAYVLATTVERGSVSLGIYGGGSFFPARISAEAIFYSITGRGLSARCLFGSCVDVRKEIESGYHKAFEVLGAKRFSEMFDKAIPYVAKDDATLIDVERGVIECIAALGTVAVPIPLTVPTVARLRSRMYCDLRLYADRDALVNGVYGALCSLASFREQDWNRFLGFVQPIFETM